MFNINDAIYAANILGVTFDKYTIEEFLDGINIELEHGLINPKTNVTNNDLIITAKIALAHLNEFPNYYNKIELKRDVFVKASPIWSVFKLNCFINNVEKQLIRNSCNKV